MNYKHLLDICEENEHTMPERIINVELWEATAQ